MKNWLPDGEKTAHHGDKVIQLQRGHAAIDAHRNASLVVLPTFGGTGDHDFTGLGIDEHVLHRRQSGEVFHGRQNRLAFLDAAGDFGFQTGERHHAHCARLSHVVVEIGLAGFDAQVFQAALVFLLGEHSQQAVGIDANAGVKRLGILRAGAVNRGPRAGGFIDDQVDQLLEVRHRSPARERFLGGSVNAGLAPEIRDGDALDGLHRAFEFAGFQLGIRHHSEQIRPFANVGHFLSRRHRQPELTRFGMSLHLIRRGFHG